MKPSPLVATETAAPGQKAAIAYVVDVAVAPVVVQAFDAWLPGHVAQILKLPGFVDAEILSGEPVVAGDSAGWQRRRINYRLRNRADLDSYFNDHAERMRADALQRFGDRVAYERRVFEHSSLMPARGGSDRCLNCGSRVSGAYCATCGQRAQVRNLSLAALFYDALHDLADLDSRVWRTLRALLLRPGFLTNEFLAGRRTSYLPPFRLYLVLSLIFFVLLSCSPGKGVTVVGSGNTAGAPPQVVTGADPEALREAVEELRSELAPRSASDTGSSSTLDSESVAASKVAAAAGEIAKPGSSMVFESDCSGATWSLNGISWIEPLLKRVCERLKGVSKREFGRAMYNNVPKMLFFCLPLLALVNLVLYAFRKRKYVEHLLFYVHLHAFAFLLLTLQILAVALLNWAGLGGTATLLKVVVVFYLFIALFRSMRVVYSQSRTMTALKYLVVLTAYGVFSLLTLIGITIYTALTV